MGQFYPIRPFNLGNLLMIGAVMETIWYRLTPHNIYNSPSTVNNNINKSMDATNTGALQNSSNWFQTNCESSSACSSVLSGAEKVNQKIQDAKIFASESWNAGSSRIQGIVQWWNDSYLITKFLYVSVAMVAIYAVGTVINSVRRQNYNHVEVRPQPVYINNQYHPLTTTNTTESTEQQQTGSNVHRETISSSAISEFPEQSKNYYNELLHAALVAKTLKDQSKLVWVSEISDYVHPLDLKYIQNHYPLNER